jgi:hypothetical protein
MDMSDAELFGRIVVDGKGVPMGCIDLVIHQAGGRRVAVVRQGRLKRRWYRVSLTGATLVEGRVIAAAGFERGRQHDGDEDAEVGQSSRAN